jgi:hypothetical protein
LSFEESHRFTWTSSTLRSFIARLLDHD